jgi:ABC-type transport system involved in multi-copper enzyme maturation permease subunit
MTWFAWRQFRVPALIAAGLLAAAAVTLGVTAHTLTAQWTDSGAAACQTDCRRAIEIFVSEVTSSATGFVYQLALVLVYLVPALIGLFWGAPMVARELETGTHRLAWNQSFTRTRWLATKLALGAAVAAATSGLLSWAVTAWSGHVDASQYFRITPMVFGARGIVPIGYALFALALGVTLGMLIRRTVPAMAATLGIYVAAVLSMPLWVRSHLVAPVHSTSSLDLSRVAMFDLTPPGLSMEIVSGVVPDGSWVLSNSTITSSGAVFTGPADPQYCGSNQGPDTCLNWVGTLGLRQDLVYQPASHFWPLQWAETGIFVALAAALVAFCFWWVRRLS